MICVPISDIGLTAVKRADEQCHHAIGVQLNLRMMILVREPLFPLL